MNGSGIQTPMTFTQLQIGKVVRLNRTTQQFKCGRRFVITHMNYSKFTVRRLTRGQISGPPLIYPMSCLHIFDRITANK